MERHGPVRPASGALAAAVLGLVLGGLGFTIVSQAAPLWRQPAHTKPNAIPVDVELVLAVDVSFSMTRNEQVLQREGYRLALTSKEFLQALRGGAYGRIAVTYVEWAGRFDQHVILPWRLIEGPELADAVAAELGRAPYQRAARTSISAALNFAQGLFATSGYRGVRRIIDISGDGPNNSGGPVAPMRDVVVTNGIIINGLPLMIHHPSRGTDDAAHLDWYYKDCVTGGAGSFVVAVRGPEQFVQATRRKMVLEVAGRTPKARVIRVSARRPRISCLLGDIYQPGGTP